jgi:hypothetical protein
MTSPGDSRDTMLRTSIDFYNCVMFQKENGIIQIRQLDTSIIAPFAVDLQNEYLPPNQLPSQVIVPMLKWNFYDSAYETPCVMSNYALVPPQLSITQSVDTSLISYTPNSRYYPRLDALKNSGWFVGAIGQTQINQNIIQNPTATTALAGFQASIDLYMKKSSGTGYQNDFLSSYQALLTAKQLAIEITKYSGLIGQVSLDDPNMPDSIGDFIGTILNIQNCDMQQGVVSKSTRRYSVNGSYLDFDVAPLGSFTGYWKS